MENNIAVNQLQEHIGHEITSFYLVAEKELREGKNDHYLRLKLKDKTGGVSANIWKDAQKTSEIFEAGDVIKVQANVVSYKGQVQLSISRCRFADQSEYDLNEFLTTSKRNLDEMTEEFWSLVDSIGNPFLNKLLHSIFDDKEFWARFIMAPAAKSWHHNYIHGLIEHTLSVIRLADYAAAQYPVDRDMLICGAFLHDVAKVIEYDNSTAIEFTDIGRLIGHLSLSDQLICEKSARIPGFPDEVLLNLRHLVLSHHGTYENASVRLPQTLEAVVLHHCDNLDAQTTGVAQVIESAPQDAVWSEFDRLNSRYYRIYKPQN